MYQLTQSTSIKRIADTASIPADPANTDYQQYLAWRAEGNEPLPADPVPEPKINEVTMRQARLALLGAGLLADVTAALNDITDANKKAAALIEWEFSNTVKRDGSLVQQLAPTLGLTESQLDSLFTQAATL